MTYDYQFADKFLTETITPSELSDKLRRTALELSLTDKGVIEEAVLNLQRVVLDACTAFDLICEKGGSDE